FVDQYPAARISSQHRVDAGRLDTDLLELSFDEIGALTNEPNIEHGLALAWSKLKVESGKRKARASRKGGAFSFRLSPLSYFTSKAFFTSSHRTRPLSHQTPTTSKRASRSWSRFSLR